MFTEMENIQQLLQIHADKGVPMEMSAPFLLKLAGKGVEETATEAGFTRTHFYLTLRGERTLLKDCDCYSSKDWGRIHGRFTGR
ncbi:MAG: hypothetical protein AB2689_14075 [Candidatus Thiodiazotropha taylori]